MIECPAIGKKSVMRIAASTYLNSAPLVHAFAGGQFQHRYTFIGDAAPSRCAAMLARADCDIALIPVIEYQRIPDLWIVPDVAVASKERVQSVLLAAKGPLEKARTLALDTSSRTSQALVRILFQERYGFLPQVFERTPDANRDGRNMLEAADAALLIGDPAMRFAAMAAGSDVRIYDLAEEWRAMTGLPFVFAIWAIRPSAELQSQAIARDFQLAKRQGIAAIPEIARRYSMDLALPEKDLLHYLRQSVNYDLDAENVAGLQRYFELAAKWGLIPQARELQFVPREESAGFGGRQSL